jgi:signal transduction histidine kinase/integral membrane sensor domain MASE1
MDMGRVQTPVRLGTIALSYFLAHELAFLVPDSASTLMAIWPAAGIGLAALLLSPRSLWPAILLTLFVSGNVANVLARRPLGASLGYMTTNVLESWTCAWLFTRWCGERVRFDAVVDVGTLIAAAMVANAATALLGAATAVLTSEATSPTTFASSWQTWWVVDGLGILLVTPVVVVWARPEPPVWKKPWLRFGETVLVIAAVLALDWAYFGSDSTKGTKPPHSYMLVAPLVWGAVRLGPRATATLLALGGAFVVALTRGGIGFAPLGGETPEMRVLWVQVFVGLECVIGLLLTASFSELRARELELKARDERLRTAIQSTARSTGLEFFASLVQELARALHVRSVFVAQLGAPGRMRTLARWDHGPAAPLEIDFEGSAFAEALKQPLLCVPRGLEAAFPASRLPADLRAESFVGAPIRAADGTPIGLVAILDDEPLDLDEAARFLVALYATRAGGELERLAADEAIRRLNAELEGRVAERTAQLSASNTELEAFAYSVSHDLRSPLRAIDGFAHALGEDYGSTLDTLGKGHLDRIRAASQRMDRVITDLLELSRVSRTELRRTPVDVSAMAREIAADLARAEPARAVEVSIAPDLRCEADPGLFRILLENLLGNAWKFTSKTERAKITVGAAERDGRRVFVVADNGAGFDMVYVNTLFGAFKRLHRAEEFDGTGIGLATVKRIVLRHGGEVWAEGRLNEGATLTFRV